MSRSRWHLAISDFFLERLSQTLSRTLAERKKILCIFVSSHFIPENIYVVQKYTYICEMLHYFQIARIYCEKLDPKYIKKLSILDFVSKLHLSATHSRRHHRHFPNIEKLEIYDRRLAIARYYVTCFSRIIGTSFVDRFIGVIRNFRRPLANFD